MLGKVLKDLAEIVRTLSDGRTLEQLASLLEGGALFVRSRHMNTISMPKEVYAAIEHVLDEFLWVDYPERMKYFEGEASAEHNNIEERREI